MSLAVVYNLGTWSLLSLHSLQVEIQPRHLEPPLPPLTPGREIHSDTFAISVADPGSSAFLTLGWKKNPDPRSSINVPDHISESLLTIFFG
jgi:hypothetical protein